jgi:hypothetical protein
MLFNREYAFRGIHADKVNELTASFDDKKNKLFDRNLDVYLLAPIVGFLYGKKSELDIYGKDTKIFLEQLSKENTTLWFNYRLIMLLDEKNEPEFDKRVEKAFKNYGTEQAKPDEELYESYVRGGVDILHEKLISNISQPEDYIKNLYNFMDEFQKRYGQNTDEILNLLKLART